MSGIGEASLFGSVFTTLEDEGEKERFLSTASAYVATTALAPVTNELPISEALVLCQRTAKILLKQQQYLSTCEPPKSTPKAVFNNSSSKELHIEMHTLE